MSAIFGLAGALSWERHLDAELPAMSAALQRRGPDDNTWFVNPDDRVALGFRHLRTTPGQASPGVLFNEDRSLMMVCDGHVFNDADVRAQLLDRGHTIGKHSSELLLHLYEDEGIAGWRRADGQFAIALWDGRTKRLVLGRDFLGVRPLYYWRSADGIAFASEIKAILRHSRAPRAVDETAVADFLTFTSVPGPRTLFRDIEKVQPGSAAIWETHGTVRIDAYWHLLQNPIA